MFGIEEATLHMCLHLIPFNIVTLEYRYLLVDEFIDVIFMLSLSGRQCSVFGKSTIHIQAFSWRPLGEWFSYSVCPSLQI